MEEDQSSAASGGIEVNDNPERTLIRMWGDVDAALREQASMAMVKLLHQNAPFVIDVSQVAFIDSSGIAFVLQVHRMATDKGSTAVLRDPPVLVIEMLDLIGIGRSIPFEFSAGHAPDTVGASSQ